MLTSSFLTPAVGSLFSVFSKDDIERGLRWKGLDSIDAGMMQIVQQNAVRFYSATVSQREALLSSAARAVEE